MQRADLERCLIVSCQPVPGGPMDSAEMVVGFALAALSVGAAALRIESVHYVQAVRAATTAPIIGIVKRDLPDSPVRITPFVADAEALADAGADIVAFDATLRSRPDSVERLIAAVHARGKLAMADCSSLADAQAALALGVDFVGTTLSGYVGGQEPIAPDLALIAEMAALTPYVIAEGRIRTPDQAAAAIRAGAHAVVVGSAITRTEHATAWFKDAIDAASVESAAPETVLAIDIGGTKILATLVRAGEVIAETTLATPRDRHPDEWIAELVERVRLWHGQFRRIGIAVTGLVTDGHWSALNPATLSIPDNYPLVARMEAAFGMPVIAVNDAQAAAWGEHRFGAGAASDIVFLTISTGVGGGVVLNGRPLLGLAGHFGLIRGPSNGAAPIEDGVSGRWMAEQARRAGKAVEAPAIFAAAAAGEGWATAILSESARKVALLCADIQLMFDPARIVIGGGIGLAEGYLDLVRAALPPTPPRLVPVLVRAHLGPQAGAIGVADMATDKPSSAV